NVSSKIVISPTASSSLSVDSVNNHTNNQSVSVSSGGGSSAGGSTAISLPPGIPLVVRAAPVDGQAVFMWDNPTTPGFAGAVLVRNNNDYPASVSDGTTVYRGNAETFTDTNVSNGTKYFYSLFAYNGAGQNSNPIRISLAPQKGIEEVKLEEVPVLQETVPDEHFAQDLTFGTTNLEVTHMQQILNVAGVHVSGLTTGYFGTLTQAALKKFQKKYGLSVTGEVDAVTRDMLHGIAASQVVPEAPNSILLLDHDLKRGDQEEAVNYLQEFLTYEGSYPEAIINGNFSTLTQRSVVRFQKKYGVTPAVGFVGYKTRHTIEAVSGL
ncbi:MAG: peptidoglycan-binding protein, partial [Candidatus Magasanikbacteria bacterium]|nr:peptidoglycan-binding protein [Candidatus Magasanikbacteria bacterium]